MRKFDAMARMVSAAVLCGVAHRGAVHSTQRDDEILQINAGFCVGIVLRDNVVIRYAPIVRYMYGWSGQQVREYVQRKGWSIK